MSTDAHHITQVKGTVLRDFLLWSQGILGIREQQKNEATSRIVS